MSSSRTILAKSAILLALLVVVPHSGKAEVTEADKRKLLEAFLEEDRHAIRRLAADHASQRIDFLDITYVEPNSDSNGGGVSVAYKWNFEESERSVDVTDDEFRMRRIAYGIDIDGKYAFGDATNNSDLSTAKINFAMERGNFGKVRVIENSVAFQDCFIEVERLVPQPNAPGDDPIWDEYEARARPLEQACWADNGIDEVLRGTDSTYVYTIDFNAGIEGNQSFSERNTSFGLSGVIASQPSEDRSRYNVFDLPFRWLRNGFTDDLNYIAPWPSLRVNIDQIDASDNEMRTALTNESRFTRGTAEVAFQTIVANVKSQPIRFNISYRYFHEFSAPEAIKLAGMDAFGYTAMSLRFPARLVPIIDSDNYEFFFAYTTGQLPFDLQSEQAVELGFSTNMSQLARLFDN